MEKRIKFHSSLLWLVALKGFELIFCEKKFQYEVHFHSKSSWAVHWDSYILQKEIEYLMFGRWLVSATTITRNSTSAYIC